MSDDAKDPLSEGREAFQRCRDHMNHNHQRGLEDLKFSRLDDQWPESIKEQRDRARRPCLTINKMPSFIRQVVNDSRQNKPSISVHPVDSGADPETADVYAGIIRNIETVSNADVSYDTGVEQAVSSGFGYWRVNIDYAYDDAFDLDIKIERVINQFAVFGDPNSTAADSSDWDVAFVTDMIPKAEFKRKYKGKSDTDFENSDGWKQAGDGWLSDKGVLIAEWWRREEVDKEIVQLSDGRVFAAEELASNQDLQIGLQSGTVSIKRTRTIKSKRVTQTIMSGADILQEPKEFPGCYIPIVPVYGDEITVEGVRHFNSLIHGAKDAQRMFNYWRTTSTELVALSPRVPFIGPKGAFDSDAERWATANTESHSHLEYDGQTAPIRQPIDVGVAAGALQEALNAADDMKAIIGIYDASLGARSNEVSGKAIMARQREGDVATFHFIDNVSRAIRHTGRILIGIIPHVYSGERIMRLIGEDGKPENRPVNQPYPKTDETGQPVMEEEKDEAGHPKVNEAGERVQRVVMAMHDLSVGKYDVTVKSGPSFTSRREEAAMQMTELVRAYPAAAPAIADIMAENFDWPGADKIAERFAAMNPANKPGLPPEVQQQIEQGKQMIAHLQKQLDEATSEAGFKKAELDLENKKIDLDQFKAQTDRMKVEGGIENDRTKIQVDVIKELSADSLEPPLQ